MDAWLIAGSEVVKIARRHRLLTMEMSKRELIDRYAGQILGSVWSVLHPVAIVLTMIFVFAGVLKLKVDAGPHTGSGDFTMFLLSGLLPWLVLQDVIARGPLLIAQQSHLVKLVSFPVEVLSFKSIPPAFVTLIVGLVALLVYTVAITGSLPLTYLALLPAVAFLLLLCVGLSLLLSALGVFLKDLKDIVQILVFLGIYVAPIFYTIDMVPRLLQFIVLLNPFTAVILTFQDILFYGDVVHPLAWVCFVILSIGSFFAGARLFVSTKPFFGSYL